MFNRYNGISVLIILYSLPLIAYTSIVYNMRISIISRQLLNYNDTSDRSDHHPHLFTETPFGQSRHYNEGTREADGGTMNSYMYYQPSHYLSVDFAFARIASRNEELTVARTQMDDLLFSGGYGHAIKERGRIAYSFLFGVPMHRDYILEIVQFGTGHFGLGPQLDCAYHFRSNNALFFAARCLYFIPRNAQQKNPCLPSYPCNIYKVRLGFLADLIISYTKTWHSSNACEIGYNPTIGFAESVSPFIAQFDNATTFTRHSFFGAYIKNFCINRTSNSFVIGLSSGFDSKPKNFRAIYHLTGWLSWSISL